MTYTTSFVSSTQLQSLITSAYHNEQHAQKKTELLNIVKSRKTWIPKSSSAKLKKCEPIPSEITMTGNSNLLKSDRIILPEKPQEKAIELAHEFSLPGKSQMERRLRSTFFFHDMQSKVIDYVNTSIDCRISVDKKTVELLAQHRVPTKNWEVVAVDLFGPMLSSNHVIVVQDLGSRYPAEKLVEFHKSRGRTSLEGNI